MAAQPVALEEPPAGDPVGGAPTPVPEVPVGGQDDFSALSDLLWPLGPAPSTEPPAEPPAAATVEPPAPVPPVAQPVPPAAAPAPKPPAAAAAAPTGPTTEEIAARRKQVAETISQRYTITPEDAQLLQTEPEKVLPRMVGNLFVDVYDAVYQAVIGQMGPLVQQHVTATQGRSEFVNRFFQRWPALKEKPEYSQTANRAFAMYRQLNPNATVEQIIEDVGAQVMLSHRLPLAAPPASPVPASQPQPSPPFRPAAPGAAAGPVPGAASAAPKRNFFDELAREVENL